MADILIDTLTVLSMRVQDKQLYDQAVTNLYGLPKGVYFQNDHGRLSQWRRQLDEVMGDGFFVRFWTDSPLSNTDRRRLETFAGPHGPTMRKIYLIQKAKRASSRGYRK